MILYHLPLCGFLQSLLPVIFYAFLVSAGGIITRSARGVDDLVSDLSAFGYPETPLPTSIDAMGEYVPPAGHPDELYFRQVCGGYKDAEPDIYC
ncbi:hypothetical protein [Niastella sp. OAS944]|uniref:hypothetical protein n=1 Tax=Niastella sp. OAS944 TaxID=2664089 RepID=UPI00349A7386|nr:hypothetical protein [Chitinophagaceae bacterium OAS944]